MINKMRQEYTKNKDGENNETISELSSQQNLPKAKSKAIFYFVIPFITPIFFAITVYLKKL